MAAHDPLEEFLRQSGVGSEQTRRRTWRWAVVLAAIVLLLVFGGRMLGLYTDWLWFTHDAGQPQVFSKMLVDRALLWVVGVVLAAAFLLVNIRLPMGFVPMFAGAPSNPAELAAANTLKFLQSAGRSLGVLVAVVVSMGFAAQAASLAPSWWWFSNATAFGRTDPIFGLDLGFYVFRLPLIQGAIAWLLALLVTALVLTAAAYLGIRSLATVARVQVGEGAMRFHLSLLGGSVLILFGLGSWFGRYASLSAQGPQFVGPGYAQVQALTIHAGLAVLTVLLGVAAIVNGRVGRPYRAFVLGVPSVLVLALLGTSLYPSITQRFVVEPNKLQVESLYAKRAIDMTRYAFGLDRMRVRDFEIAPEPTLEERRASATTLANMRLWDPEVLERSIDGLQSLRPYYTFADVDIDRYPIGGKQTMVMLSARDIDTNGLSQNARTWINQRLQYTHGFGLIMSPVNASTPSGQPEFYIKDFPPKSPDDLPVTQPRIYFSDYSEPGFRDYAIVNTKVDEFDFPSSREDQSYRWTGGRGVPIGGPLAKLAYSAVFGDSLLLVSPNLTPGSRLLYRRNIRDRASRVYPMLRFDSDPYVVLYQGRLVWIMDGYATTDRIPYSALVSLGDGSLNYVRNVVKVVVDAYSGQMNAYAMDESEPILKAYRRIFPTLVKPRSEAPAGLDRHLRYGEDMFKYQAAVLTQYHVTNPQAFLNNEDAWDLPNERGRSGGTEPMLPYYVQMRLPDEKRDAFMLILPFTPRQKDNMIGWMAAHCDPEQYGELVLYKFPKDNQTPGPLQMEAIFDQDREIADINRQLNNDQSEIVRGNLLVIPIGSSVMYVKPLFLQSRTRAIPELKKVALGLEGRVVVGDSYEEALGKLFAGRPSTAVPSEPVKETPPSTVGTVPVDGLRDALQLLDQADAALRAGEFAKYGELQKQLRERLRNMLR